MVTGLRKGNVLPAGEGSHGEGKAFMNICRMAAVTGAAGIALIATGVAGGAGMAPAGHSSSAAASYRLDAMAGAATRNAGQHTAREEWAGFTVSGSIPVPTAA